MIIIAAVLDVVSHTIKEVLVRTQPLNQEKFNFKVSIMQLFIAIFVGLPLIKITQRANHEDSPFFGPEYDNEPFYSYTWNYIQYSTTCIFGGSFEKFTNDPAEM